MERPAKKRRLDNSQSINITKSDIDVNKQFDILENLCAEGSLTSKHIEDAKNVVQTTLQMYKDELSSLKQEMEAAAASPKKGSPMKAVTPAAVLNEFKGETKLATIPDIKFSSPNGRMYVEFYPSYFCFKPQNKVDKRTECASAIIPYREITHIVSVPQKQENRSNTLFLLSSKIAMQFRKGTSDVFCADFSADSDPKDFKVVIQPNTVNLPNELTGSRESAFNRIVSELAKIPVHRQDKTVFRQHANPKLYFVDAALGANAGHLYPLSIGVIFLRPIRVMLKQDMECFAVERGGSNGRFFDLQIKRKDPKDGDRKTEVFSMIEREEYENLIFYFQSLKIPTLTQLMRRNAKMEAKKAEAEQQNEKEGESKEKDDENMVSGENGGKVTTREGEDATTTMEAVDEDMLLGSGHNNNNNNNDDDDDDMSSDDSIFDPNDEVLPSDDDASDSDTESDYDPDDPNMNNSKSGSPKKRRKSSRLASRSGRTTTTVSISPNHGNDSKEASCDDDVVGITKMTLDIGDEGSEGTETETTTENDSKKSKKKSPSVSSSTKSENNNNGEKTTNKTNGGGLTSWLSSAGKNEQQNEKDKDKDKENNLTKSAKAKTSSSNPTRRWKRQAPTSQQNTTDNKENTNSTNSSQHSSSGLKG